LSDTPIGPQLLNTVGAHQIIAFSRLPGGVITWKRCPQSENKAMPFLQLILIADHKQPVTDLLSLFCHSVITPSHRDKYKHTWILNISGRPENMKKEALS
jgi:hypothetical protein